MKSKSRAQRKLYNDVLQVLGTTSKVLVWLVKFTSQANSSLLLDLISRLSLVLKTRGPTGFLDYIKKVRVACLCYLSGNIGEQAGVKLTKDSLPQVLGDLIPLLRVDKTMCPIAYRYWPLVFTALYCTRSLRLGKEPDLTPITDPGRPNQKFTLNYLCDFWLELDGKDKNISSSRILWKRFHMTSKSGPNGQALWSSLQDLYTLPSSLVESIKFIGGPEISSHIDTLFASKHQLSKVFPIQGSSFRKVTWFPDKETKVRVIAILDYWSQTVLKPLHHWLFTCLKVIPQDCTFDQGSFYRKIKGSKVFYSIDLTAATDRFPIDLIGFVLEAKLGPDFVKHWKNIMIGYPFDSKHGRLIYQVGNPMGAYSSWSSFALAHHFVVYTCVRELGLQWSDIPYCLLGDDIVIGHKAVAELYLSKISELGLDVSPLKTHVSSTFFEFAKRLFFDGREITPFPISGLHSVESRSYLLASFFMETRVKGWFHPSGIPVMVNSYYGIVKGLPSRIRRKFALQACLVEQILDCIRGFRTATDTITSVCWSSDRQRPITNAEGDLHLFQTVAMALFTNKIPTNKRDNKGLELGKLAEDLVIFLTGGNPKCESDSELMLMCIYALPILNVYGQVEEQYMSIHRSLRSKDISEINFLEIFKLVSLPMSDEVFVRRQSHLIVSSAHSFSKELLNQIDDFPFKRNLSPEEIYCNVEPLPSPGD